MALSPEAQTPSSAARPNRLASFWHWWTAEISRMLPERLSMLRGGSAIPLLFLEGDEAVLVDTHAAPGASEKRVSLAGLDEPRRRAAIRTLLEGAGETRGRARAALGHDEALVRRVSLPAATEENLAQVLGFEMDRLSPFRADEVYFDYRVAARDAANGQVLVDLAIARREVVDARVRALTALGASVQGVALRDDATRSQGAFDLLPSEQRGERETARERMLRNALIGVVLVLFAAALILPLWRKREAVVSIQPVVAKAEQEAKASDAVMRELERQAADYNFILARKYGTYPAAAFLEEMTRILPDNTWLQQLDLKTSGKVKEVVATGETASSSKLIELLEQSKLLQNPAPRGPYTRGSVPGSERFLIGAETRPRAQPEPQPIAAGPTPPGAAQPTPAAPTPAAPTPTPAAPTPAPAAQAPSAPASSGFGPFGPPPTAKLTPAPAPGASKK